jgi:hypothetical protein
LPFAAAILASAALLAAPAGLSAQGCDPVRAMEPLELAALMRSMGYDVRDPRSGGTGSVTWRQHGDTAYLRVRDGGARVEYYNPTHAEAGPEALDAWNARHPFTRAYLDGDGDPVLKMDLALSGGVCEDALRAFLRDCERAWRLWISEMGVG